MREFEIILLILNQCIYGRNKHEKKYTGELFTGPFSFEVNKKFLLILVKNCWVFFLTW